MVTGISQTWTKITNPLLKWKTETKTARKAGSRPPRSERDADTSQASANHKAGPKASPGLFSLDCLKVLPRNRRTALKEYLPQLSIWVLWQTALLLCVWPVEHMGWPCLARWEKPKDTFSGENRTKFPHHTHLIETPLPPPHTPISPKFTSW